MSTITLDGETLQLAKELAQLTGENITGAVTATLRERLEREQRKATLLRDLEAISQECASDLPPGPSSTEHGDLLYDEHGFPN